jgi:NAD(P)-dependent dehydrogenase (short-subunit alcohol dehydrogenase family)
MRLEKVTALVTGANSGIEQAVTSRFPRDDARLHMPRSVRGLSRPNGRRPQLVDVRKGTPTEWLRRLRPGGAECPAAVSNAGHPVTGVSRCRQRPVDAAMPALASLRWRSMAR